MSFSTVSAVEYSRPLITASGGDNFPDRVQRQMVGSEIPRQLRYARLRGVSVMIGICWRLWSAGAVGNECGVAVMSTPLGEVTFMTSQLWGDKLV